MTWKHELQILDIDDTMRFEIKCSRCQHTYFAGKDDFMRLAGGPYLYLDEVEQQLRCKRCHSSGTVDILLLAHEEVTPFSGGLA